MQRYRTIDGLRGYAALAVVFYHLTEVVMAELEIWCPEFIIQIFKFGFLGVPVFFVISGFAIAASVNNLEISRSFFGNFILRRSLRLDPPYWAAILLGIILLWMKNQYLGGDQAFPSWGVLLAHAFYLQDLLGFPHAISVVFWTLCQEVQLYLFFIAFTWLIQSLTRHKRHLTHHTTILAMMAFGIYSLACDHRILLQPHRGLFFANWHYFLIGILAHRMLLKTPGATAYFLGWLAIETVFQSTQEWRAYAVCGIVTATCLLVFIKTETLDYVLTDRLSQYLGRISYSLYLVHADVGWKFLSVAKQKLDVTQPIVSGMAVLLAVLICIALAHLFYRMIERPSSGLSRGFRRDWQRWLAPSTA